MKLKVKVKETLLVVMLVMTPIMTVIPTYVQVQATAGSEEFCNDNPDHFACDGKIGNSDENGDNNDNERDCENPPSAASCNNGVDTNGVETDSNSDSRPSGGCYNVGYDDGRNSDFSKDAYFDNCGSTDNPSDNQYYNGFIDGCESVEGNTLDVCVSATDT